MSFRWTLVTSYLVSHCNSIVTQSTKEKQTRTASSLGIELSLYFHLKKNMNQVLELTTVLLSLLQKNALLTLPKAAFEKQLIDNAIVWALIASPSTPSTYHTILTTLAPLLTEFSDIFPRSWPTPRSISEVRSFHGNVSVIVSSFIISVIQWLTLHDA